jgi:hypothetical protein
MENNENDDDGVDVDPPNQQLLHHNDDDVEDIEAKVSDDGIVYVNDDINDDDDYVNNDNNDDDDSYFDADDGNNEDQSINSNHGQSNSNNNRNEITLETLRDNIVADNTSKAYIGDLATLLMWINDNEPEWLTPHGRRELSALTPEESEGPRRFRSRVITVVKDLLRNSDSNPIVFLQLVTAPRYMEYIFQLQNKKRPNCYLSKSSYGNQRSALVHLFRMHNRLGMQQDMKNELGGMFNSFFRRITKFPNRRLRNNNLENDDDGNAGPSQEGKVALSIELYRSICGWLLDFNTQDGIFAYCYLVLTWNLACRAGNTSRILFRDVTWTESFDSFAIKFSHSKTDQLGEEAKYARHIFSNPLSPIVCPVLALSLYLTCCFNSPQVSSGQLFPGVCQDARFSNILLKILIDNREAVHAMGYSVKDIGTHSIRKGAVSYLASLPGGPPAASTCIRAGWTMGKVKDIYMRYVTSGDQFVGRCLSLLSVLRTDFAVSPCHFTVEDLPWIEESRLLQFPMVGLVVGFEKITRMCLACLLYHYPWLKDTLNVNHVFAQTSYLHRCSELQTMVEYVHVTYPWNDICHVFTGIPPHISVLQELSVIKSKQERLIGEFVEEVSVVIGRLGSDGGRMTEDNLRNILTEFQRTFMQQINNGNNNATPLEPAGTTINRSETGRTYELHYFGGEIHRLPRDWLWPRCGVFDLWRQWWIGDSCRKIPPLRILEQRDFRFLNKVPLADDELHGRTGKHKEKRREARKTWCDLKFLMEYVHKKVVEKGAFVREVTPTSVDEMFRAIAGIFTDSEREAQIRWSTVVLSLRRRIRRQNSG